MSKVPVLRTDPAWARVIAQSEACFQGLRWACHREHLGVRKEMTHLLLGTQPSLPSQCPAFACITAVNRGASAIFHLVLSSWPSEVRTSLFCDRNMDNPLDLCNIIDQTDS